LTKVLSFLAYAFAYTQCPNQTRTQLWLQSSWPHSAIPGWVLFGCHLTYSPSLSGFPDMWKFHSRSLDWCRHREPLITYSKWLQTVISTVLGAEKGLLFLDLSQKHFKLLQCHSAKRRKAPAFQRCQCKQFLNHLHSSAS